MIDFESATDLHLTPFVPENADLFRFVSSYDVSARPDSVFVSRISDIYKHFSVDMESLYLSTSYGTYGAYRLLTQYYRSATLFKVKNGNLRHENAFKALGLEVTHLTNEDLLPYPSLESVQSIASEIGMLYINATDGRFPDAYYFDCLFTILKDTKITIVIDLDSQFLRYDDQEPPIQTLLKADITENCHILCTLSKEFGLPGLRYGYILSIPSRGKSLDAFKYDMLEMEPFFTKHVASQAIGIDTVCQNIALIRERAVSAMNQLDTAEMDYIMPHTGINVYIRSRNSALLRSRLKEHDIRVGCGAEFGPYDDYIRWTLAHDSKIQRPSLEQLIAIERQL